MTSTDRVREPRLVIAQRPTRRDHLHGAWWPYTTDIERELAPVLLLVAARFQVVLGVMLNRDEWPGASVGGQSIAGGRVKLSWYGLTEPHLMVLRCGDARRIAILVLPPETPEPVALSATLMASAPGNVLGTAETMARAQAQAGSARESRGWSAAIR